MERYDKLINLPAVFGAVCGSIVGIFGGFTPLLYLLVIVVFFDYITGLIVASMHKSLKTVNGGVNSQVGFAGLLKKVLIFIVVGVGAIVDRVMGDGAIIRDAVMLFFVVNECISILENVGLAGLPLPKKLVRILEQLNQEDEN